MVLHCCVKWCKLSNGRRRVVILRRSGQHPVALLQQRLDGGLDQGGFCRIWGGLSLGVGSGSEVYLRPEAVGWRREIVAAITIRMALSWRSMMVALRA